MDPVFEVRNDTRVATQSLGSSLSMATTQFTPKNHIDGRISITLVNDFVQYGQSVKFVGYVRHCISSMRLVRSTIGMRRID